MSQDRTVPAEMVILDWASRKGDTGGVLWARPPETEAQALMETAPGHPTATPTDDETAHELKETLADAMDALHNHDPRLWEAFVGHHLEGVSYRKLGARLGIGKSHTHRLVGWAAQWLQGYLTERGVNPDG